MMLQFDAEGLRELLEDFHTLTHVRVSVYDANWDKLIAYPEKSCPFCTLLKDNPVSRKLCKSCDQSGFLACRNSGSIQIYRCHAGLIDAVAPIRMNDITIGYMMFGQMIDPVLKKTERNQVISYALSFCSDAAAVSKAYDRLCCKDERQIRSAAKIIEACACYLWMNQLAWMDTGNLSYRIAAYIGEHLADDLSVNRLCEVFDLSRSRLFEISKQYFGVSISRYIKKRRIHAAAQLLEEQQCRVGEAAEKVGISDYNYFSKIFKAEIGYSPSAYRGQK